MPKAPHKSGHVKPSIAEALEGAGSDRMVGGLYEQPITDLPHVYEEKLEERVQYVPPRPDPASDARDMDFGDAIRSLKLGRRVQRAGWNGKGMWLAIWRPDADIGDEMDLPFIYMSTVGGKRVPWLASQTDMLAEDWSVVG